MPQTAAYPLLEWVAVRTIHQHIQIVIAFQGEGMAATQHSFYMRRRSAGISEHAKLLCAISKHKLYGLTCVMRDWEGVNLYIADIKSLMTINYMHFKIALRG